jgi:hypothetical protein
VTARARPARRARSPRRRRPERRRADHDLVEQGAERVDVRTLVDLVEVTARLLGRHVGRRAERDTRDRLLPGLAAQAAELRGEHPAQEVLALAALGQPPVEHDGLAVVADHHVLGLEVPVHDPPRVCEGDRVADGQHLREKLETTGEIAARQRLAEGAAPHPPHRVVERAVMAPTELVHRNDRRVLELPGDPCLVHEAPLRGRA